MSDTFSVKNGLKIGNACLPLLFNLALDYIIREVKANQEGLELNAIHRTVFFMLMVLIYWAIMYKL